MEFVYLLPTAHSMKIIIVMFLMCFLTMEAYGEKRKQVILEGKKAVVGIDLAGGGIFDFHLSGQGLNPLIWNYPPEGDLNPREMGHFVCFDRWGSSSEAEQKHGMPSHGEAAYMVWKVLSVPVKKDGVITVELLCELPMAGMKLKRTLSLSENASAFTVSDEITNVNKLVKAYNIVQHPSIAPPFLDENVIVDANISKGFAQWGNLPYPEEPVLYWPEIAYKGKLVDLRRLFGDESPNVVSFPLSEGAEFGWVTASNPAQDLMIGYIWEVDDYPWLNLWRQAKDGKPFARGLEFGTTGLHQPFTAIFEKQKIFGRSLFTHLDAGASTTKSYTAFLTKIPQDFKGVADVSYRAETLVVKEVGEKNAREITIPLK